MHNYKGSLRREQHDLTPTKSSWDQTRQNPPPQRYDLRNDSRYDQKPESRYDTRNEIKNESRYDAKYEKSELSYYQSQSSRVYYDHEERPSNKSQPLLDDKYYFNALLPVIMRPNERDEHELRLRIAIQAKVEKGQSQLHIYLTDDSNPKFLWTFSVKEVDFMTLKNSQKLKVSYAGFPEMLENCLHECEQSENHSNFLVLETRKGEGRLQFLESGKYRVTNHLELTFKVASDEEVKDYLAVKMLAAGEEIEQNRLTIRSMEHTLNERMKEIERKNSELNAVLAERDQLKDQFRLEMNQKKTELETIKLNELTKTKKESELELKELKQRLNAQIDTLSKQKADLATRLAEARERVSVLESIERDQVNKISRLEEDKTKANKDAEQLRADNREMTDRRFQNEKTIAELNCKVESLRSELEDKKTIISSTVQLKETNSSQISSLEQLANDQKKQITRLDQKVSELEAELAKFTTNNAELLEKLGRQKEKLQERGEIIKEQEKELKDLKKSEATLERDNERLQYEKEERDNKIKTLQDQLEKVQKKFEDEQAMVAYLQKNLNERPGLRTAPYYPPTNYTNTSYLNRELPSQLSTNSNVNITNSRTALTSQRPQKTEKYEPNIKRYEERSRSPVPSRLPQQKEPEDDDEGYSEKPSKFDKPYPVKFKMSQPRE